MNSVDINPNRLIPQAITKLTSITDDMVKGQQINENEVASYLKYVDIIIAHNAQFDRTFFEITFPSTPPKAWGCSIDLLHNLFKARNYKFRQLS